MTSTLVPPKFPPFARLSTNQNALIGRQSQQPPRPAPVVDLDVLQNASRVLQDQFVKDSQIIPDLGDTLNICAIVTASVMFLLANWQS
jgi:hypothetical protein